MKIKIFHGPRSSGKTREAMNIANQVGASKSAMINGRELSRKLNSGRLFYFTPKLKEHNVELLIIDDCPGDFNIEYFICRTGGIIPDEVITPNEIITELPISPDEIVSIPQIIIITDDKPKLPEGASFSARVEFIEFPIN